MKKKLFIIIVLLISFGFLPSLYSDDAITVKNIKNGSTIEASYRNKTVTLRLIGVYDPRKRCYCDEAKNIMEYLKFIYSKETYWQLNDALRKMIAEGDNLRIEFDLAKKDEEGNYLVYIFHPSGRMINLELIRAGLTYPMLLPPNIKYRKEFNRAFKVAHSNKKGIWKNIPLPELNKSYKSGSDSISIMTFNVENLFDTKHDRRKNDYTYLPLAMKQNRKHRLRCASLYGKRRDECLNLDWNEKKLQLKLDRIAKTLLQVKNGKGPDILVLQEVENRAVLQKLNRFLGKAKYKTLVHIESNDGRGIDVAIFSRLPLVRPARIHQIRFYGSGGGSKKTRGIIETLFRLPGGDKLYVFGVHFPSQASPFENRKNALQTLARLKTSLPPDSMVITAGDFNITGTEEQKKWIYKNYADDHWLISHWLGCEFCPGTSYYPPKNSWSFFDVIMLSKNLGAKANEPALWMVLQESIRIANEYNAQIAEDGTPNRFFDEGLPGVSDHWPIVLDIVRRKR